MGEQPDRRGGAKIGGLRSFTHKFPRDATMPCNFAFTKLVVADVDAMAHYYRAVYGLRQVDRIEGRIGTEQIDEIVLSDGSGPPLILIQFAGRPAPPVGEQLLGFFTEDLDAAVRRCEAAGGQVFIGPELHGDMNIAFLSDPEGHVAEVVQQ